MITSSLKQRFYAILIACFAGIAALSAQIPQVIYANAFNSAESVSDWTLTNVTWNSGNGGRLSFSSTSGTATMPPLAAGTNNARVTISGYVCSYISLLTSPDGGTFTSQGTFTGTYTKPLPDGTKYIQFKVSSTSSYLLSVVVEKAGTTSGTFKSTTISTAPRDWYSDSETDNYMQFTSYNSSSSFKNFFYGGQIFTYHTFAETGYYPYNINNDNATDFYQHNANAPKIQVVKENGAVEEINLTNIYNISLKSMPCDYNSDGLTDFMAIDSYYNHKYLLTQGANNTFTQKEMNIMSREMYENGYEQPVSSSSNCFLCGLHIGGFGGDWMFSGTPYVAPKELQLLNMDIDGNGLIDLLDTQTGELLFNMGNNTFVKDQLGGYILFRDLDNNGKLDYISYNSSTKDVIAHILQNNGTWSSQTVMSSLSMDNQVWAYDYDGDGDVDIILPFSYRASNGGSFLVIMVNDGNGNFTMKENYYSQQLSFIDCVDLDNDGFYDIVANEIIGSTITNVVWLKGNALYQFALQETKLFTGIVSGCLVADINNDGKYELIIDASANAGVHPLNFTPAVTQTPNAPAMPEFAFEPSSGYLKVSWQAGSDPRYSAVDLTYEVRIGTAPGKGDIVYANAYANGRRRNLSDGNANYALEKLFDASSWDAGNYYISIQAINPMKRGSAFSQEAVFTKTALPARFIISEEKTTSDNITVTLLSQKSATLDYIWDFADGQIVETNTDQSIYKLKYTVPGLKKITLQTRNTQGDVSAPYSQETFLFANKFTANAFSISPSADIVSFADLDNDGKLEALTNKGVNNLQPGCGVYTNDGLGNFTKLGKIFNTNLTATDVYFDYNNDGLIDIYKNNGGSYQASIFKNSSTVGDITFPVAAQNLNSDKYPKWDWNNDGKADEFPIANGTNYLFLNNGDYENYTQAGFINYQINWNADHYKDRFWDLNKDGYKDVIYVDNAGALTMLLNNGNGFFTEKNIQLSSFPSYNDYKLFADINSDGYVDLFVYYGTKNQIYIYINNENESFNEPVIIAYDAINGTPYYAYDFDNNGYLDISTGGGAYKGILYFYENLQTKFYKTADLSVYSNYSLLADADGDGVQDFIDYKNNTTVTNTPPSAPTNVRYAQTDETLLIEWDAAQDNESPAALLRYNISVKKQGATGDNAYIISPLNGTKNNVPPISIDGFPYNPYYRTATKMEIPLSAFTAGINYEIQIQTLDGWNAISDFSAPVIAKVVNNPQIKAPASICAEFAATIEYKGTGAPSQRIWNWDGGTLQSNSGNFYDVIWNTPGTKNISVTVGSTTDEVTLLVSPAVSAPYIPATLPTQTELSIALQLPDVKYTISEWYYHATEYIYSWGYPCGGSIMCPYPYSTSYTPVWKQNFTNGTATLTLPTAGFYTLKIAIETPCGIISTGYYQIQTVSMPKAEIYIVTAQNGKNVVNWEVPSNLLPSVTGVNVYKEGSTYNSFQLETTLPLSQTSYTDIYSNSNVMSSRYRLAWSGSFGTMQPGTPHKGIHLMINKGIGNGWNLFWGQYEGAIIESFRILRGTTPEDLTQLAEVAGSVASYSDFNPPIGDVYYAIEYSTVYNSQMGAPFAGSDFQSAPQHAPQFASGNSVGLSNVVFAGDAFNAKLATALSIDARDELTPSQPSTYLVANITPVTATYQAVNWTVVSGGSLVTLNASSGILTINGTGNGNVVIKATTIDGSDISAQKTILVKDVVINTPVVDVTLNKNATTLTVGGTEQLIATVLPTTATNQNVSWSSNAPSVASVLNGLITAHAVGEAVITVTTQDGGITKQCIVTVSATSVSVTGVNLNKTATTLTVGGTEQLIATVLPTTATNQNVSWSSNAPSVASVLNGLITAHAVGEAVITVTTQDGGFTKQCTVTVNQSGIVPSEQIISFIGTAFYKPGTTTPTSWDTDFDFQYISTDAGNVSLYTISNITFIGGGEFKLRLNHAWITSWGTEINQLIDASSNIVGSGDGDNFKATESCNYSTVEFRINWATNESSLTFPVCSAVGLSEVSANNMLSIYPNPVKDVLIIKNEELRIENYSIFNVTGQAVGAGLKPDHNHNGETTIDVSSLPSGMYFVKVGDRVGKFIKE